MCARAQTVLMIKSWSSAILSHAVGTVLGRGRLTRSASLEMGRCVLRPKRQSPANRTATASITPTTSPVRLHTLNMVLVVHEAAWLCELLFLMKRLPADWSTCQLSDRAVCGYGIKTRMLDCVRSDSKSVDLKFCKEVGCVAFPIRATVLFCFFLWDQLSE